MLVCVSVCVCVRVDVCMLAYVFLLVYDLTLLSIYCTKCVYNIYSKVPYSFVSFWYICYQSETKFSSNNFSLSTRIFYIYSHATV